MMGIVVQITNMLLMKLLFRRFRPSVPEYESANWISYFPLWFYVDQDAGDKHANRLKESSVNSLVGHNFTTR